jgi:hypothetical protein
MANIDTSAEVVEDLARILDDLRNSSAWNREGAATLRALRAERDEAITRGNDWCDQARKLRDERDRLREALHLISVGNVPAEYANTGSGYRRFAAAALGED